MSAWRFRRANVRLVAVLAMLGCVWACSRAPKGAWSMRGRAAAQDEPDSALRLNELAYSIEMTPDTQRPVHRVLLPEVVYRNVAHADLSDIRVYNADGRQVPYAVRTLEPSRDVQVRERSLPFFPLSVLEVKGASAEGLSIAFDADHSGPSVQLRAHFGSGRDVDAGTGKSTKGYILDARDIDRPIAGLRIEWDGADGDYVVPVRVDASEDLQTFRPVSDQGMLVDLEYRGARIRRDRIDLKGVQHAFLRLRTVGDRPWPASLASVRAEVEEPVERIPRRTRMVQGVERDDEAGVYDFDLGSVVPVDGVRIVLPQDNMLVQASLASSATAGGALERVYEGAVYRIGRGGTRIQSRAIEVPRRKHRHWVLRVADKGGGLGGDSPKLEFAWHPDQLLFIARGPSPFHLAFGHHAAGPTAFSPDRVLDLMTERERHAHSSDIRLGPRRERAGESALEAPPPPPRYQRYLLWAVLVIGALAIAVTALRMLRGARDS